MSPRLGATPLAALALAALALLVGCGFTPGGSETASLGPASGVRGTVILGPTCPVGEPGSTDPIACLTPYSAQIVVLNRANEVVARVTSDSAGRFEVVLPPGEYLITPLGGDPYPIAQPVAVDVPAGQFVDVQINYDTGIR